MKIKTFRYISIYVNTSLFLHVGVRSRKLLFHMFAYVSVEYYILCPNRDQNVIKCMGMYANVRKRP